MRTFQPGPTGIVITVTGNLDQPQTGLVGGIFLYGNVDPSTGDHDEIDTELVSNDPNNLSVNTYDNQPAGPGNPQTVSLPQGDSVTQSHTYQMVWTSSQISWFVDGTEVATTASNVPTAPMSLYLNFWVPGNGTNGWTYAYNGSLQPASTAQTNQQFGFNVSSVQVAQLPASTPGAAGLIANLSINQQLELIYIGYFDRAADGPGYAFWQGQYAQAQSGGESASTALTNIANAFTPQPETAALYSFLANSGGNLTTPAAQSGLITFIANVYQNIFGRAPDTAGAAYWLGQITSGAVTPGSAILAIANGATGTDATGLQNKISVALDFTNRTNAAGLTGAGASSASFLAAARDVLSGVDGTSLNDTSVITAESGTGTYISGATSASAMGTADPAVITITGSNQLIHPGMGGQTIQFMAGASADTLVLGSGGVDQVSGFDLATDALDVGSLLSGANLNLGGDIAALNGYLTVADQGTDAVIGFDPTGLGGGNTIAVLHGLGSVVTGLDTLIANGAIRMS
jgi:hypothetical protein